MLADCLSGKGFDVSEAANGEEALKMARETPPDLIVLDIETPGIDGVDGCRNVRDCAPVPIIIMSAPTADNELHAYEAGADGYFAKPFELQELLDCIHLLTRKASLAAGRSRPVTH